MTSTGTRKERNVQTRSNEAITEADKEFINGLKVFSESSNSVAGLAGPSVNNSPKTPAGNYLAREGDSMIGPIAFGPPLNFRVEVDANNTIDIGPLGENIQYSSNVQLDDLQPNSSVLDIIANAAFDGQILVLRTFAPTVPYDIRQATLANGGNIQTTDGDDIILSDLQMIVLVFDESLVVFNNTGGTWRVLSTAGGGGTGTFISSDLVADQTANIAVNDHIEFDRNAAPTGADGGIVLQTGAGQLDGIFELIAGKTYFLSGAGSPIKSASVGVLIAWYDRTNAVEIGRRVLYDESNTLFRDNQPKAEIIFTPVTDVDVDLRIVAFVGTPANLTGWFAVSTYAHIFEFSGVNQGGGGPVSVLSSWKNPVRAKTLIDVGTLSSFPVLTDGVTLVEDDRVLLTEQTIASENGIYDVGVVASGVAPLTRSTDFDENSEVVSESFVAIEEGTIHNHQVWHLVTDNPITVGSTAQVWEEFAPGTSGGPDLGGGSDGIDGAGEYVNDGRVALSNFMVQLWEETANLNSGGPTGGALEWIPPFGEVAGRLIIIGGQAGADTRNSQYSDDFGDTWANSSLDTEDSWGAIAYDPTGRSGSAASGDQGIIVAGSTNGVFNTNRNLRRSTDRGVSYSIITSPNTDLHRNLIWAEDGSGQFVITNYTTGAPPASNIRGIWTSPDGSIWTVRTTPAPIQGAGNQSWSFVAYSPSLDLYVCTTLGESLSGCDVMTSSDAITWTLDVTNIPTESINSIIWSEGQQKFVMLSYDFTTKELLSLTSPDGINWERFSVATSVDGTNMSAGSIVWAPNLSMYVISGARNTVGFRFTKFWVSNDAETWEEISRQPASPGISSFNSLAYSEEYTKFWAAQSIIGSVPNVYRTIR